MSWWHRILHTFPTTSDIYWTVVSAGLVLLAAMILTGELLAIFHVRNFVFFTYYIRYSVTHKWLIVISSAFLALGIFVLIHFVWGHGFKIGPNS
jgi:hypothetical protein